MVAARAEVAGSAALAPDAEAEASDSAGAAAAAGPTAVLAGGTCNCKSRADYTLVGGSIGGGIRRFRLDGFGLMLKAGDNRAKQGDALRAGRVPSERKFPTMDTLNR